MTLKVYKILKVGLLHDRSKTNKNSYLNLALPIHTYVGTLSYKRLDGPHIKRTVLKSISNSKFFELRTCTCVQKLTLSSFKLLMLQALNLQYV
jgi:hypothetical protein